MRKVILTESQLASVVRKSVKRLLKEGGGAGYDLTISGLNVKNVRINGKKVVDGDTIIEFTGELDTSLVEWSANGYYEGVSSEGIYYNGIMVDEISDDAKTVNGGFVNGEVALSSLGMINSMNNTSKKITSNDVKEEIKDILTDFTVSKMVGAGYVHVNLGNPITLTDIEVDNDSERYVKVNKIRINAKEMSDMINWYFKNAYRFDEIYGETDDTIE